MLNQTKGKDQREKMMGFFLEKGRKEKDQVLDLCITML
jgi:hypothetical protein